MFKLVKLALVVGALAAVWMLVPISGRTLHSRWVAAGGPEAFARAGWAELDRALATPAATPKAKAPRDREPVASRAPRPTEAHTERDRQAVDRIVAEHLKQ